MSQPSWNLRPARLDDHAFLVELHESTMRDYVEQVWGWNVTEQAALFEGRFQPERWQIIQVEGKDIGLLKDYEPEGDPAPTPASSQSKPDE